ncbi:MAG: AAA family ATPase [Legionella sp.]|uniref:protein kinase domain-containing protein n=1 Tax=Legionella sp. TaxID=459 RepID=UPI00283E7942|nr:AAA family ATPase [Legionella sp.]
MSSVKENILSKGVIINDTYEIQFFIGEGAFGEVYRIKHKYLGVQVMKVFKEEYVSKTNLDTVTLEAKILSKLTHPNIVRVFETNSFVVEGKKYYFITMGFVSGETLTQLLTRKIRLPIPVALSIQNDLLTGLKYVQEQMQPIVHRDISTDNILLSYEKDKPIAMLSDFGLAQSIDQLSKIPNAAGRYIYLAPECFWGTYLPTSDVFSSGVVLYKMITGMYPWEYDFDGTNEDTEKITTMMITSRRKEIQKPSIYNESCTKYLDQVILKALSKDLEERYKTADEFLTALNYKEKDEIKPKAESDVTTKKVIEKSAEVRSTTFKVKEKGKGFDLIAGMDELKETLYQDIILPLNDKELYEQYKVSIPNGMLLYGPPGCGKTFIAQKFAEEISYNYVELKPSDLASIYVHGTQEKIAKLFNEAKEKAPTIIFIDELDAILPNREGNLSQSYASEVNEFLAQMTECHQYGIFIIAATNRPEKIDPAILRTGRMDKVIYLAPPDLVARKEMFKLHLQDRPTEKDIDFDKLAVLTALYVASDIKFLVNEASRNALKARTRIKQEHLEAAIKSNPPSISESQLKKYETFRNNRNFN